MAEPKRLCRKMCRMKCAGTNLSFVHVLELSMMCLFITV
uniref:Uncharacterized protein n=1 Tax=Nelumbo nucifera TaxID=4432 RepID=A0A822XKA1_NELNU|nr:TPA_asm: hypothetical protein HUJ06_022190 [Nelumbo nucifera]